MTVTVIGSVSLSLFAWLAGCLLRFLPLLILLSYDTNATTTPRLCRRHHGRRDRHHRHPGPKAAPILARLAGKDLQGFPFMSTMKLTVAGIDCHVSRSGYTGEDGFEVSPGWGVPSVISSIHPSIHPSIYPCVVVLSRRLNLPHQPTDPHDTPLYIHTLTHTP